MHHHKKTHDQQETMTESNAADQAVSTAENVVQAEADSTGSALNELQAQLAETQAKLAEMQDAFLRARADLDNTRRRAQEDVTKAYKFAVEGFAQALLPVRDSLEMALKVETTTVESLHEGVEMTLKQLDAAFEKNKLCEVAPQQGEKLDPMKHQAVSMVPAEQEANTIVTVMQKGYALADRLLRPAIVVVSQGKQN